jgi:hypothetical protein
MPADVRVVGVADSRQDCRHRKRSSGTQGEGDTRVGCSIAFSADVLPSCDHHFLRHRCTVSSRPQARIVKQALSLSALFPFPPHPCRLTVKSSTRNCTNGRVLPTDCIKTKQHSNNKISPRGCHSTKRHLNDMMLPI